MKQLKISKASEEEESKSLEKYLQEINKLKPVSSEGEAELAHRIREGDAQAMNLLVGANLRLVVSVAKQYINLGLPLPDLINEGNLGLIKAALRFDETKGLKFTSYAIWWIRQNIIQSLVEQSRIVRLPLNKVGIASKVSKAYHELEQEFEREPSLDEIAEMLGVDVEEIITADHMVIKHVSVDSPVGDLEEQTLIDVMINPNAERTGNITEGGELQKNVAIYAAPNFTTSEELTNEERQNFRSLQHEVRSSLPILSNRQKEVICYYLGIGVEKALTLEQIGSQMNLTTERIRQIKDKAVDKIRLNRKRLRLYSGDGKLPVRRRQFENNNVKEVKAEESDLIKNLLEESGLSYEDLSDIFSFPLGMQADSRDRKLFAEILYEISIARANIYLRGYKIFGDKRLFDNWLFTPNKALNGIKPYRLFIDNENMEKLIDILGRIEFGIYS